VPITILAQGTSSTNSNAPGGAILTFAFMIILFAVVATVLYWLLFARPHRRVPPRRIALASASAGAPAAGAAHAAAVAAGLPTASGGGSTESATEPAGAKRDTVAGAADGTGKVTGEAGEPDQGTSDEGTTDGTEASE
jgi:hypothetical protein